MQGDGFRTLPLAVVCTVMGLATAYGVSQLLDLGPGSSAGLLSGGLTQSAAMGTATEAVNRLAISKEQRALYVAHIAGADAVCSIFGIAGAIWLCSVGALEAGLLVGHMRTRHPLFGRIPVGAVALMTSLGLATFVAMTGLHAGPVFCNALREVGIGLLPGGVAVTLVPLLTGLVFGRFVLGMQSVLLLGLVAGALAMTAAMGAVQRRSQSPVAFPGHTPAGPILNILLTLCGTVMVILTVGWGGDLL